MGTIVKLINTEHVETEAAEWVARFDSGELSSEQRTQFERWLKASPLHRRALQDLGAFWAKMDCLAPAHSDTPVSSGAYTPSLDQRGWRRVLPRRGAVRLAAAAALILLIASVALVVRHGAVSRPSVLTSRIGEHRDVRLSDGSTVSLNADTELSVEYSSGERRLHLSRGEAFFEVAADPVRPFVVAAGSGAVRALGTAFNVRYADRGAVEVMVSNGRVQISTEGEHGFTSRDEITGLELLATLDAGQRASFDSRLRSMQLVDDRSMSAALAWRSGMLSLDGKTLGEAVSEISRFAGTQMIIDDPLVREQSVGGYFRLGDMAALLSALKGNFGLECKRAADGTIHLAQAVPH